MKTSVQDIELVQQLYLMQVDLHNMTKNKLTPREKAEAKKQVREFRSLLRKADWKYMGGEDVLESLKETEREVQDKLRSAKSQ